MKKYVNNELVEMTTEEVSSFETEAEINKSKSVERRQSETAKATAQTSGNTKLLGLGLSQEEATALTGYTPE